MGVLNRLWTDHCARRAARCRFADTHPNARPGWVHVVSRGDGYVVVAVEDGQQSMPPPETFYRVSTADLTVEECDAPPGYGPWM